jgi:hypothetical protein
MGAGHWSIPLTQVKKCPTPNRLVSGAGLRKLSADRRTPGKYEHRMAGPAAGNRTVVSNGARSGDGVSTKIVPAKPCNMAAHETDGTTTCFGIPNKRESLLPR